MKFVKFDQKVTRLARKQLFVGDLRLDDDFKQKVLDESRERQKLAHPFMQ